MTTHGDSLRRVSAACCAAVVLLAGGVAVHAAGLKDAAEAGAPGEVADLEAWSPLVNGSFEAWSGGAPVGWEVGGGRYAPAEYMAVDGGAAMKMLPPATPSEAFIVATARQTVQLRPHARYTLGMWLAKDGAGSFQVRVAPLAPR